MHSEDVANLLRWDAIPTNRQNKKTWALRSAKDTPVIYARGCCDTRTGRYLTATELRRILIRLRLYISENLDDQAIDLVKAVDDAGARNGDDAKKRHINECHRQFFGNDWLDVEYNKRREIVDIFCRQSEQYIEGFQPEKPVRTFYYIGYALVFTKQMLEHSGSGSHLSWFMNLFMAACKADLNDADDQYEPVWGFADSALCFCAEGPEVAVAEVLHILLAWAWYSNGVGFGIHPSGLSVASSLSSKQTMEYGMQLWRSCEDFRDRYTQFEDNAAEELRKLEDYPRIRPQRAVAKASCVALILEEVRRIEARIARQNNEHRREMRELLAIAPQCIDKTKSLLLEGDYLPHLEAEQMKLEAELEPLGSFEEVDVYFDEEEDVDDDGDNGSDLND
ncbi:hypothetical protein BDU57DRAFT_540276 [Ampelomyces quisqualis]|uniref:Uncharacterized protein n=1 Tax=Ampelomyces quisqualis TaxID=50730 RepID=A0A6A5QI06_AMPQU|nr:hypothetical protein BDU57DRAFT_540276 [Ampelomyces quisqualis]